MSVTCAHYEAHTTTPLLIMCVNLLISLYVLYYSQPLRDCFLGGADGLKSQASDKTVRALPTNLPLTVSPTIIITFNLTAITHLGHQLPVQHLGTPHVMEKPNPHTYLKLPALLRIVNIINISPSPKREKIPSYRRGILRHSTYN